MKERKKKLTSCPNDASGVFWVISKFFSFLFFSYLINSNSYI